MSQPLALDKLILPRLSQGEHIVVSQEIFVLIPAQPRPSVAEPQFPLLQYKAPWPSALRTKQNS